jgi:4-aminobutyrate aminotransferase
LLTIYPPIGKGRPVAELSQILKQATGVLAARGEGVLLYDEDNRRYLDFTAGIGVMSTGHCHPGWSKRRSVRWRR